MIGFDLNKTRRHFTEVLEETFPKREAEQLMRILVEDLFGIDMKQQLMEPQLRIDEFQYSILEEAVKRLKEGVPVQYTTRKAWFDGLLFYVDKSVLIPRPETEGLVKLVAEQVSVLEPGAASRPLRIWDVGTGSGCIAIALAKRFPDEKTTTGNVGENWSN